jgi:hypothetical protein
VLVLLLALRLRVEPYGDDATTAEPADVAIRSSTAAGR